MAEVEMVIDSIRASTATDRRLVILKEKSGGHYLPIWIGTPEADSILTKMENVPLSRPLTHDLLCSIVNIAGLKIRSVIINKLKKDTYYAKLVMTSSDKSYEIDCQPSDALAVAVRVDAPIFADEKVIGEAGIVLDE